MKKDNRTLSQVAGDYFEQHPIPNLDYDVFLYRYNTDESLVAYSTLLMDIFNAWAAEALSSPNADPKYVIAQIGIILAEFDIRDKDAKQ